MHSSNGSHKGVRSLCGTCIVALALAAPGLADSALAWPTLVCTAGSNLTQQSPAIAPNSIGGAYIAYRGRVIDSGPPNAFGTHLTHSGALFPPTACGDTLFRSTFLSPFASTGPLRVAPDGDGGVFVAVQQDRAGGNLNLFMQRVHPAGFGLWGSEGVGISTANGVESFASTSSPAVAADGTGGCYVIWQDNRFGATHEVEIFLQHVLFNGLIDSSWPADGLRLTTQLGSQLQPTVVTDDSGGVFAVWQDGENGGDIKALRVLANAAPPLTGWNANGNTVAVAVTGQNHRDPVAAADGSGGVFVAWANAGTNIYASRLLRNGGLASGNWVANGLPIADADGQQAHPSITVGPDQRAIITWMDLRQPSNGQDVFAQSIGLDGTTHWTTYGVPVAELQADQAFPRLVSTAASGAVITWDDKRNFLTGSDDIFAQALDSQGQVLWQTNGVPIAIGSAQELNPVIAPDGDGGAIIAYDRVTNNLGDVLAARVYASGAVGGVTEVTDHKSGTQRLRCSPNPARISVSFDLDGALPSDKVLIRDLAGRTVALIPSSGTSGTQSLHWDLRDGDGKRVAPGVYFVQLLDGAKTHAQMLVVAR